MRDNIVLIDTFVGVYVLYNMIVLNFINSNLSIRGNYVSFLLYIGWWFVELVYQVFVVQIQIILLLLKLKSI